MSAPNYGDGTVMACLIGGCPAGPTILVGGQTHPAEMAIDDTHIYWTTDTDIMMALK